MFFCIFDKCLLLFRHKNIKFQLELCEGFVLSTSFCSKITLSQRFLKDPDWDSFLCYEGGEQTDFHILGLEKLWDLMRTPSEMKDTKMSQPWSFYNPFLLWKFWELYDLDWLIPLKFIIERGCFCFCQAFRCQPHYLSPRGQFRGACSVTTSVAGWQQPDGGACAPPQQPADPAGIDLGSEQNLQHPGLCIYQPVKPGGPVSVHPFSYHIFVLIWRPKQLSCDQLLWKYLIDYAPGELGFGGATCFTKLNTMTFKNTK